MAEVELGGGPDPSVAPGTEPADGGLDLSALTEIATNGTLLIQNISQLIQSLEGFDGIVLPVSKGGTGRTSFTLNGVVYGNGTSPLQVTAQGAANTVLVANAGAPSFSTNPTVTSLTATTLVTSASLVVVDDVAAGAVTASVANEAADGFTNFDLSNDTGQIARFFFGGTTSGANYAAIGTEDAVDFRFFTAATDRINITGAGVIDFLDGPVIRPTLQDYSEEVNALGAAGGTRTVDLTLGNVVTATVSTSANTFAVSNPSASGTECSFTLYLTNGGSQTVNWMSGTVWAGGVAPTLTAAGLDVLVFTTHDAGTTWYGFAAGLDMS